MIKLNNPNFKKTELTELKNVRGIIETIHGREYEKYGKVYKFNGNLYGNADIYFFEDKTLNMITTCSRDSKLIYKEEA